MAGLVGYESSEDEDEVQAAPIQESPSPPQFNQTNAAEIPNAITAISESAASAPAASQQPGIIGPLPQPEGSSNQAFPPLEEAVGEDVGPVLPPGSPYSANRTLLRELTLPTVPNMDIPPSPPGSPPPETTKKFEQFLELKQKGIHFNSKIAQSSSLKNPGLMDKLFKFVDIDQRDQYRTTLDADLWDPNAFPKAAYKEQLRQSQTEIGQARARSKGGPVEFVPGIENSRGSTPRGDQAPVMQSTGKRKTRFDM